VKNAENHQNRLINTEDTPTSTNTVRRQAAPASVAWQTKKLEHKCIAGEDIGDQSFDFPIKRPKIVGPYGSKFCIFVRVSGVAKIPAMRRRNAIKEFWVQIEKEWRLIRSGSVSGFSRTESVHNTPQHSACSESRRVSPKQCRREKTFAICSSNVSCECSVNVICRLSRMFCERFQRTFA